MRFYFYKTPFWLKRLYPQFSWSEPVDGKQIYLTFDDGPVPGATTEVMELLDQYNAKATFFAVGENIRKHPEVLLDVVRNGHQVGNHTFNHMSGWGVSQSDYLDQIRMCDNILKEVLGEASGLFRPPYGRIGFNQGRVVSESHKVIMWQILSGDFDKNINYKSSLMALKKGQPGDILVFHDSDKYIQNVRRLLPEVLKFYTAEGFEFKTIKSFKR